MSALTDIKAQLVADLEPILAAEFEGEQAVTVLDHEPRSISGGQITVTVAPSNIQPDWAYFVTRVYCPVPDAAAGAALLERAVSAITDHLPGSWLEPVWSMGWDDRLDEFMAAGTIGFPRSM